MISLDPGSILHWAHNGEPATIVRVEEVAGQEMIAVEEFVGLFGFSCFEEFEVTDE